MPQQNLKRIADHRNFGFTPKDAMFEHNAQKASGINRQITTPAPFNEYSEQEILDKGGEVKVTGAAPARITWDNFKSSSTEDQAKWLTDFAVRYGSIKCSRLAAMFNARDNAVWAYLTAHHKELMTQYSSKGRTFKEDLFKKEMLKGMMPLPKDFKHKAAEDTKPAPEPPAPPKVIEPKKVLGAVKRAVLTCDADDAPDAIRQLGMAGTVKITIYNESEEKENGSE